MLDQPEVDVGYDHLVRLERDRGIEHIFLPEDAHRNYSVRELLEGVRHERDIRSGEGLECPYKGKIDFGILTIREDENNAVLRRFDKVTIVEDQRRYRIRTLALPKGDAYTIAVLRCVEQGNADAQDAARDLIEDLRPRFLLVVGIAGGVPANEFTLGDVVVSTRIIDFSVEAVIKNQDAEYALGGGSLHSTAAKLAADLSAMVTDGELDGWNSREAITRERPPVDLSDENFYGETYWKKSLHEKMSRHFKSCEARPPLVTSGAIASSDRLIKEDETHSGRQWGLGQPAARAGEPHRLRVVPSDARRTPILRFRSPRCQRHLHRNPALDTDRHMAGSNLGSPVNSAAFEYEADISRDE